MQNKLIDFRSDTVTQPTEGMRQAMANAEVGDDVYEEDPTVNKLETMLAERAGFEAGLFVTSGTQSNLVALLTHCQRGDEYIVGDLAHIYRWEVGGASVLGGLMPAVMPLDAEGKMDLSRIQASIKPDNVHFPKTTLVCIENTFHGHALPMDYLEALKDCQAGDAMQGNSIKWHLDGARLFNAAIYHNKSLETLSAGFDSVSLCLSKGLGAPMGSVLCGDADFIKAAKRWRKMLGGGLRQSGVVAAGGLHALTHHFERLAEDHANADYLADQLGQLDELDVEPSTHRTNMLFLKHRAGQTQALYKHLAQQGVKVGFGGADGIRMVTHMDVNAADCQKAVDAFKRALKEIAV